MLSLVALTVALAAAPNPTVEVTNGGGDVAELDDAIDAAVAEVASLSLRVPSVGGWSVDATKPERKDSGAHKDSDEHSAPKDNEHKGSSSSGSSHGNASSFAEAGAAATPGGRQFGVGLQLGYPTAVTAKYMLRADQGLVVGIGGFSGFVYDAGALSIHVDYVWHPNLLTQGEAYQVTWYVGGGGNVLIFNSPRQRTSLPSVAWYYFPTNVWLAARIPLGINLALTQLPFEIYLEADPSILVFPSIGFGLGASIGGRGYF